MLESSSVQLDIPYGSCFQLDTRLEMQDSASVPGCEVQSRCRVRLTKPIRPAFVRSMVEQQSFASSLEAMQQQLEFGRAYVRRALTAEADAAALAEPTPQPVSQLVSQPVSQPLPMLAVPAEPQPAKVPPSQSAEASEPQQPHPNLEPVAKPFAAAAEVRVAHQSMGTTMVLLVLLALFVALLADLLVRVRARRVPE
jgi:hypothetical protein